MCIFRSPRIPAPPPPPAPVAPPPQPAPVTVAAPPSIPQATEEKEQKKVKTFKPNQAAKRLAICALVSSS